MKLPCALRSLLLLLVLVGVCAAPGSAGEGDDVYQQWLMQCIEALRSDDDATRTGPETALLSMGAGAMPAVLPELERLQTDREWSRLRCHTSWI